MASHGAGSSVVHRQQAGCWAAHGGWALECLDCAPPPPQGSDHPGAVPLPGSQAAGQCAVRPWRLPGGHCCPPAVPQVGWGQGVGGRSRVMRSGGRGVWGAACTMVRVVRGALQQSRAQRGGTRRPAMHPPVLMAPQQGCSSGSARHRVALRTRLHRKGADAGHGSKLALCGLEVVPLALGCPHVGCPTAGVPLALGCARDR